MLALWFVGPRHAASQAKPAEVPATAAASNTHDTLAPPPPTHEYWRVMALSVEEYVAGRWLEARALCLRGHRIFPNARSWRCLGMTAFNLGQYAPAMRELNAALRDPRRRLSGELRQQTQELLDRTDTFVGVYRLHLSPGRLQLRVDGLNAETEPDGSLLLSVGQHLLEADAHGFVPMQRPIVVDGTDGEMLRIELRRETEPRLPWRPPPEPTEPWQTRVFKARRLTWLTGAGGLVLAGAAGALAVETAAENQRLLRRCERGCYPEDHVTARRDRLDGWSAGLLGTGSVLIATAVVLFLMDELSEQP